MCRLLQDYLIVTAGRARIPLETLTIDEQEATEKYGIGASILWRPIDKGETLQRGIVPSLTSNPGKTGIQNYTGQDLIGPPPADDQATSDKQTNDIELAPTAMDTDPEENTGPPQPSFGSNIVSQAQADKAFAESRKPKTHKQTTEGDSDVDFGDRGT